MDRHLKKLQQQIALAIAGMSAEQLGWHPPGKWCMGDVLEHLYLTYTGTTKGFRRVLEAGKPTVQAATWKDHRQKLVELGSVICRRVGRRRRSPVRVGCQEREFWPRLGQRLPKWMT